MKQYLIDEFIEDYQHGQLTRRQTLKLLTGLVGAASAAALVAACAPVVQPAPTTAPVPTAVPATNVPTVVPTTIPTTAATVAPTPTTAAADPTVATQATATVTAPQSNATVTAGDPAIQASAVEFPGSAGAKTMGYLARPRADGTFAAILVCHENRGLTEHIRDVARRFAKAGYVALAVDLLSRQGGTDKVDASGVPGVLGNTPPTQMVGDFAAGLAYLKQQPFVAQGQYGMIGFCFGGGITWRAATQIAELRAAAPYYGPNPPLEDVPKIQAAVLAHYGGNDSRINAGIPAVEQAMKQNNKIFEYVIHQGTNHAFNNDTGANYNAQAAQAAWAETLAWFDKYVRGA
ncbi:MAG: dienelactone hydrolase family protein [Chloroflexi bacterium]|nr:dienelactone hydrolase family protein [Chloroflexota bacterium]